MNRKQQLPRFRFGLQFSLLARQWRGAIEKRLEEAGLTDATWKPLVHLAAAGDGITQKDLASLVGVDGSTLVRLLDILSEKGLIERRTGRADRRAKQLFLTSAGRAAVADIRSQLEGAEAELLKEIGDEEIATVLDVLTRIAARLEQLQEESERRE
ncbi:MarR family transcriptional regulator for hemolysin [Mycoplana sp. BE70]|uniref:MarR family winged helix-turn-helix transcriptional regulator n=1 Tax=Mycoplana sp. BE70 TaxID=2817775 RepID=UPI00285EE329|nr:MarR family transcriptional regulator [Mycoplana sp. BE70]MDR6756970.1 MarR family transcriptional regulator for hemolysin [Mycoplana sp. BE70]